MLMCVEIASAKALKQYWAEDIWGMEFRLLWLEQREWGKNSRRWSQSSSLGLDHDIFKVILRIWACTKKEIGSSCTDLNRGEIPSLDFFLYIFFLSSPGTLIIRSSSFLLFLWICLCATTSTWNILLTHTRLCLDCPSPGRSLDSIRCGRSIYSSFLRIHK